MNPSHRIFRSCHILLLFAASCIATNTHAMYSQLVSFGDSTSDVGNFFSVTGYPPAPYFDGNFSDGLVWTEFLAMDLGLTPALESEQGGRNYAWGGATVLDANTLPSLGFDVPSVEDQLQEYLSDVSGVADPLALYTIRAGNNDRHAATSTANGVDVATGLASIVEDLLLAGAEHILILDSPTNNVGSYDNILSTTLNSLLNSMEGNIMTLNLTELTLDIFANPSAYYGVNFFGNCNADNAASGTGTFRSDCETLFFVDNQGHLSATGNRIVADAAFDIVVTAVPLPGALSLFISAVALIGSRQFFAR